MYQIYNGEFIRNETNENSMGGTELLSQALVNNVDKKILEDVQIVVSRMRDDLDETKVRLFWAHDLPGDPESDFLKKKENHNKFHRFIFVSNWQMQAYMQHYGLPWSKCQVIQNAIDPIAPIEKPDPKEELNIIYTPTPHRGLNVLVPVFEKLAEEHKNLKLHVFSSFKLYGWEKRDEQYKELFDKIEAHPQMIYHGTQPQSVVREQLQKSHIFAYPSVWAETSCMCLMEAMSAGLACVHSNYAALPETSANWTHMYQLQEDANEHANLFYQILKSVIDNYTNDSVQSRLQPMQTYANVFYSWKQRSVEWTAFLKSLSLNIKDRSIKKAMFTINTGT